MTDLLIGVAQYPNLLDWKKNFDHAIFTIDKFCRENVDLICFQEAFLSGYHPEVLTYDFSEIDYYLDQIRDLAYLNDVGIMIPTLTNDGRRRNSAVYVFNSDQGDLVVYKKGLTPSEKLVLHPRGGKRSARVKGVEVGVLICREVEDPVYTYFKQNNLPDIIFWPSYWGWQYKSKWGPIKYIDGEKDLCFELITKIKRPIFQANMCTTFSKDLKSFDKYGKSVFVNGDCRKVGVGAYGKTDHILIRYDGQKLNKL